MTAAPTIPPDEPDEPNAMPCKPCPVGAAGKAADAALGQRGRPFKSGGSFPEGGFDSSFVRWAYQRAGVPVPRAADPQASAGKPVPQAALKRGDLVLFVNRDGEIDHVGIYLDHGRFVHVPTDGVVTVDSLSHAPWAHRFSAGRRIA